MASGLLVSGSHLKSIEMVALRKADVAAVDSAVLAGALARRPTLLDDVDVVDSIGPLPPHPIMVRASLDDAVKRAVTDALLDLHHHPEYDALFFNIFPPRGSRPTERVLQVVGTLPAVRCALRVGHRGRVLPRPRDAPEGRRRLGAFSLLLNQWRERKEETKSLGRCRRPRSRDADWLVDRWPIDQPGILLKLDVYFFIYRI